MNWAKSRYGVAVLAGAAVVVSLVALFRHADSSRGERSDAAILSGAASVAPARTAQEQGIDSITASLDGTVRDTPSRPVARPPAPMGSPIVAERAEWRWELYNPHMTGVTETVTSARGTMVSGFTFTADARSADGSLPFRTGRFRVNLTLFSPSRATSETADGWYMRGQWTLTDVAAQPDTLRGRHHSGTIQGVVETYAPFNPVTGGRPFEARMQVPMWQSNGIWVRGNGTWLVDEAFGGVISVRVNGIRGKERGRT